MGGRKTLPMEPRPRQVLAINGGSSTIRFAVYEADSQLKLRLKGKVDRIGLSGTSLTFHEPTAGGPQSVWMATGTRREAIDFLVGWLERRDGCSPPAAVGHRVVHGMQHTEPEKVTPELMAELARLSPYDPDHLPGELELIHAFARRHPELPQVACFDTAFHRTMPRVARLLAIPRRYDAQGVQRYGFHGLSYAYLLEELGRVGDPAATRGRVILAHLGGGASLAAVLDGRSMDTSMGFTPAAGLPMGTRAGDLDPGIVSFLARTGKMTVPQFHRMVNQESGLLGVSEMSSDMRDLLTHEADDLRAAEAIQLFCYHAKKWVGAFAAALGGVDALVFSAGIGENCPPVRARICQGLGHLGIELDGGRNERNERLISTDASRVRVYALRTDEEVMIAGAVCRLTGLAPA